MPQYVSPNSAFTSKHIVNYTYHVAERKMADIPLCGMGEYDILLWQA